MNNKIVKLQLGDYFKWNNLSREDKVKRNKQIAKQYLDKGPSIQNYYNALKAYFGGFNPKNPYLQTGEPTILPGMGSSVANVVAKEYLLNSGQKAIKSTDYLIRGIQGTFPKANLSNILNKYNNEILNNGILSEFKNTGRFKNIMNEIQLEIEKVYGRQGSDAFNIIKTNPEGLPSRLGQEWIQKYNFKKGGSLKSANARKWKHKEGGIIKATKGTDFKQTVSNALGKVGNFLNSDWGKLAASGISSMFGGGNSEPSYNNNYSDIMTNTALQYMQNQQQENEVQSNYDKIMSKLHFDPSNPNANGGSIVKNHVNYLAQAPVAAKQKEFNDNYKKFLDEQVKQKKTNYITNALTNTLQTGFDLALNYKPTTKKGSSVS